MHLIAPRRRGSGLAVSAIAIALVIVAPGKAGAGGDDQTSSDVGGRGDIRTSIVSQVRNKPRRATPVRPTGTTRPTVAPNPCRWTTLTDEQVEFIVGVIAEASGDLANPALFASLEAYLRNADPAREDLQIELCNGEYTTVRTVPRATPADLPGLLSRQMITQLPAPIPVMSPPQGVAVPLHEPVFISIAENNWREITAMLTVDGTTAEVRAHPISLRVYNGEPDQKITPCPGRGRTYDPTSSASPATQAADPNACVLHYRLQTATAANPHPGGANTAARPTTWLGAVTVVWTAEWRVDGGPWQQLGQIPRTTTIERATREVTTAIETAPRGG